MISHFDTAEDIAEWTLAGSATIPASALALSPPNVLNLFARRGGPGNTSSTATRVFETTPGSLVPIRLWVNGVDSGSIECWIRIIDSSGTTEFGLSHGFAPSGWVLWEPVVYVAVDSTITVKLNTPTPGSGGGGLGNAGTWYIDDCEIGVEEGDVGKRRSIREAILARLATCTIANGYTVGVGEAKDYPERIPDNVDAWPHLELAIAEERKEGQAIGTKEAQLRFTLDVFCKATSSARADDLCDDCVDDVEKALELRSGGYWLGLGYIQRVFVAGELDVESATPEVSRDVAHWRVTVDVTYVHEDLDP